MPYRWVKISSSPPKQRRDEVKNKVNGKGGGLVGNQIFYDDGQAFALIKLPGDPAKAAELLADLGATVQLSLVDADEKDAGVQP
jgi:hypothetical protein